MESKKLKQDSEKKTIYFVRHGESEGNVGPARQGPTGKLNEKGKGQAEIIADRTSRLPIEVIISSTMTRAKQTTEEILKKVSKPVVYSDLFVERKRPTEQIGILKEGPEDIKIQEALIKNFCVPGARYSDEEIFEDLRSRSEKALAFLEKREESHILVSTHGIFLKFLAARVIFGTELTAHEADRFLGNLKMRNTALTVFRYDPEEKNPWHLITWNDHAHLG